MRNATFALWTFFAALLSSATGLAQVSGLPYFNEITIPEEFGEPQFTFIEQLPDGTMAFGSSSGLFFYDGTTWELTPTSGVPKSILVDELEGRTFIGLENGLLELVDSDTAAFQLTSILPEGTDLGSIDQIYRVTSGLLMKVENRLMIYDLEGEIDDIPVQYGLNALYSNSSGVFGINGKGQIFRIEDLTLDETDLKISKEKPTHQVDFSEYTFIATAENQLFRCFENKVEAVSGELGAFCETGIISGLSVVNENTVVVATRAGGFVLANADDGKILHRANYGTGFPDNEVFCTGSDAEGGIWISYDEQLIRVNLHDPITTLTGYPGLDGKILATCTFNEELYVGTGTGLFHLTTTSDRKEIDRIKEMETTRGIGPDLKLTPSLKRSENRPAVAGPASSRSGTEMNMLPPGANIPGMKPKQAPVFGTPSLLGKTNSEKTVIQTEKRTLFKKVTGIEAKCRKLLLSGNQLFAVCNDGLYQVRPNGSASRISTDSYVITAQPVNETTIYYSTSENLIKLTRNGNQWNSSVIHAISGITSHSILLFGDELWIGSNNAVFKIDGNSKVDTIRIRASGTENITVTEAFGKPHFLTNSGIHHHLQLQDTVVSATIPGVQATARYRYSIDANGSTLIKDNTGWHVLSGSDITAKLPYTALFQGISGHFVNGNHLLLIEDGKHIHRISQVSTNATSVPLTVSVRSLKANGDYQIEDHNLILEANANSVQFNLSAPSYQMDASVEFQYRIEGLKEDWSSWSSNATVELPFINPGDYQLQVRARNVLGKVSGITHLSFQAKKPIWTRWYMTAIYSFGLLALVWLLFNWRTRSLQADQRELEKQVQNRTAALEEQKEKVEELLLNILPKETAEELQLKGRATPRQYNSASVLFTDFKDFTKITGKATAEELVSELDRYFIAFDRICEKYGLEKIKTIGDSYMCAGGIPAPNHNHAIASVLAALEMAEYMKEVAESKTAQGLEPWQIRIGVHSGPIMAGVVGEKKFAYDIWGDTVNVASRIESSSEPGRVNISSATLGLVRSVVQTEARGKIEAKGKGELDMYFVTGIKTEHTENGKPSKALLQRVLNHYPSV